MKMLSSRTTVSLLWLIALVHVSNAGTIVIPEEITENPIGLKTDFARHAMEISDLLRMFISLIKKADEDEGREFGLPEVTTVPINLETASIEELFDRFETAAQSFRTRFLKYLKSKEPPIYRVTPISTVVELYTEKDSSKYVYEHEDVYSTSTNHPETESTLIKRASLAYILPTESSEIETETDSNTSTEVPDRENANSSNDESSEYMLTDDTADSDYSSSTIVEQTSDMDLSEDATTIAFILSNGEQSQEATESFPIVEETPDKDIILTFFPVRRQNSKSLESSFKPFELDTPVSQVDQKVEINHEEDITLNEKSQSIPVTVETINGEATFILESNEDANAEALYSPTDYPVEITMTPFIPTEESSEYTFVPLSTIDHNSDKEIRKIYATTAESDDEIEKIILTDDLGEIVNEVLSAMGDSDKDDTETLSTTVDSDGESSGALSTVDDSEDEVVAALSTMDDSEDEVVGALSTMDDSEEESGVLSTTNDPKEIEFSPTSDDSDEEREGLSTTEDSDYELFSTVDDSDGNTSDIRSAIEARDIDELLKMLKEISEKYNVKQSERRSNGNFKSRKDLSESRRLIQNSKILSLSTTKTPKLTEPLVEYMPSANNDELVDKKISSNYDEKSKTMDRSKNFSNRNGVTEGISVNSHLDVIGMTGESYPNYTHIPETSFTCEGKEKPGFYTDLETRCQVFHVCWPHRIESYLCPVGSTFHQKRLSCDYWFKSTCSLSPDYYDVNLRLRNYSLEDDFYYPEDTDIHPYDYQLHRSHPVFNKMNFLPFLYKITNSHRGRGIESGKEIDYNETIQIEFDKDSTMPTLEDLQQETTTDMIDSVKESFRELLRSFVESEASKNAESSEDDTSLSEKLQDRKYVYEKMSESKLSRSGVLPEDVSEEKLEAETTLPKFEENHGILYKNIKSKQGKEQIAPAIVFKVLETAENVVTKGILPMTRDLLAANYIKLYKKKKM